MQDKKTLFNNLRQIEVKIDGQDKKFWFSGSKDELVNLFKEVYQQGVYEEVNAEGTKVVVDLGAHIGDTAYYFSKVAEKIYAVEPNQEVFECLRRNVRDLKMEKVVPINKAVAARTGKSRLYCTEKNEVGASMIPFTADKKGFDIETISMEDLFNEYKIEYADLVKMDIEGAEYEVIESESFAKVAHRIGRMIIEIHPYLAPGAMSGEAWKIPYLLRSLGFSTRLAKASGSWKVLLNFSDGHKQWVPMLVLLAERQK